MVLSVTKGRFKALVAGFSVALTSMTLMPLATALPAEAASGQFSYNTVVKYGDDGVTNYRIPAVIKLSNGDLLTAYDARPANGDAPAPNSIMQKRSTDGGATWQGQTVIAQGKGTTLGDPNKEGFSDPAYIYDKQTGHLFNFHVHSYDVGCDPNGTLETDEFSNRKVQGVSLSVSTDNGVSWTERYGNSPDATRGLTAAVKQPGYPCGFAASGHGIQLQHQSGANAAKNGRLITQFIAGKPGTWAAYSVYSDDHGKTWKRGSTIGTDMNENKLVELSDGTLLLNSRMSNKAGYRYIAKSTDGGETWTDLQIERSLVDSKTPGRNASIIRRYPDAPSSDPKSKELLYSGMADSGKTLAVSYSYDDGKTWPIRKLYWNDKAAYSDLVAIDTQSGKYGVAFEEDHQIGGNYFETIHFGTFDTNWLNPVKISLADAKVAAEAGKTVEIPVKVTNDDAKEVVPLATAVKLALPSGWKMEESVLAQELHPGNSETVTLRVSVPANAAQKTYYLDSSLEYRNIKLRGDVEIKVTNRNLNIDPTGSVGVDFELTNPKADGTWAVGDKMNFTVNVTNLLAQDKSFTATASNLDTGWAGCRWRSISAGATLPCANRTHTVTQEDVDAGFFTPSITYKYQNPGYSGAATQLKPVKGNIIPIFASHVQVTDLAVAGTKDKYDVGDKLVFTPKVQNVGQIPVDVRLNGENFTLSCHNKDGKLDKGSTFSCTASDYVITKEDIIRGSFTPKFKVKVTDGNKVLQEFIYSGKELPLPSDNPIATKLPQTIPSLDSWKTNTDANDVFKLSSDTVVYYPAGFEDQAQIVVQELNAYLKAAAQPQTVRVQAAGGAVPKAHDVVITIDSAQQDKLAEEGYRLQIGAQGVNITAAQKRGAFWGTRTLSQMLRQQLTLPYGSAIDLPQQRERAVTLCACRIKNQPDYIHRMLTDMADLKMNQVVLTAKMESAKEPVTNNYSYYTKEELEGIVAYAGKLGIEVVPQMGAPGHMDPKIHNLPQYQLKKTDGTLDNDRLDITNPEAVAFYKRQIDDYLDVFPSKYWHMAGDEYMYRSAYKNYPVFGPGGVNGPKLFVDFINDINKYVKSKGKTLRVWNDGLKQENIDSLDKDIVIDMWQGGLSPQTLIDKGHKVNNTNYDLYFSREMGWRIQNSGAAAIYNDKGFTAGTFKSGKVADDNPGNLGIKLSIWPDTSIYQTENEVEMETFEAFRLVSQLGWSGSRPWKDGKTFVDFAKALGHTPNWENVNRRPLEDGVYAFTSSGLRLDASENREPDAISYSSDQWQITHTYDHYYQLKSVKSGKCLSMDVGKQRFNGSGRQYATADLNVVNEVGARPALVECVNDINQKYHTGAWKNNSSTSKRNNQKWQIIEDGNGKYIVRHALTNMDLAISTGEEKHVDLGNVGDLDDNTKSRPMETDLIQLPSDMTATRWTITQADQDTPAQMRAPHGTVPVANLDWYPGSSIGWADDGLIRVNRTLKGSPLLIEGEKYRGGIGTHASSKITVHLGKQCSVFSAKVGIDDTQEAGKSSSVTFRVLGADGQELGASSKALTAADKAEAMKVDVSGQEKITLFADAGESNAQDHADWADAMVTCEQMDADKYQPSYQDTEAKAGKTASAAAPSFEPEAGKEKAQKFELVEPIPAGMSIEAGTGVITWQVPENQESGTVSVDVKVTYEDGSSEIVPAKFKVSASAPQPLPQVAPQAPIFNDKDNTYTIPQIPGVVYLLDNQVVKPGTYPVKTARKVLITSQPASGYRFKAGATTQWEHQFKVETKPSEPTTKPGGTQGAQDGRPGQAQAKPQKSAAGLVSTGAAGTVGLLALVVMGTGLMIQRFSRRQSVISE